MTMNHKRRSFRLLLIFSVLALLALPCVTRAGYQGTVRVYVVEPSSRWDDKSGAPFEYGLLDFAMETSIDLNGTTPWEQTLTWDATAVGLGSVSQSNIMVMAAVFNANGEQRDAVPPAGNYFTAYPVDASAAAYDGAPGQNSSGGGYTHTVFLEEGTLTT